MAFPQLRFLCLSALVKRSCSLFARRCNARNAAVASIKPSLFWRITMFLSRLGRKIEVPVVRQAFNQTFRNPHASLHVLPDIAEFCHANEPVPDGWSDPFMLGRWSGRQDVWLHIQQYLN